jgi:hypothetical protein
MNYADMNAESIVSNEEAELALLRRIIGELSPSMKRKISAKLEKERKHFAHTSTPGHNEWYDKKLAVCAAMERLA